MAWYGMVWYSMVWHGIVRYGMVVWYGMVWYGMAWYGMTWYGIVSMVWYDMVWYCNVVGVQRVDQMSTQQLLLYLVLIIVPKQRANGASFSITAPKKKREPVRAGISGPPYTTADHD